MTETQALPRVAIVVTGQPMLAAQVRQYVSGAFDLVCVADVGAPGQEGPARLLRRFSTVLDSWGKTPAQLAAELAELHPDGIVAIADEDVPLVGELARALGLPGHSADCVQKLTDKFAQRRALRDAGLRTPRFWPIDGADDEDAWATVAREARFPAVLKPRVGTLSRDVSRVGSVADARAALRAARDPRGGFVLEEYIPDGPDGIAGFGFAGYLSVESLVWHGEISHIATSGRPPMAPPFREGGIFIPSALEGELLAETLDTAARAIRALGVTDGCLHTELKLTPDGPVIIEVNGRMGGHVDELTELSSGFPFRQQQFRVATGLPPETAQTPVACTRVGFLIAKQAPQGIHEYAQLVGLEELSELPGVTDVDLVVGPGDPIDWRVGTLTHLFRATGAAATHEELRAILAASDAVQVLEAQSA